MRTALFGAAFGAAFGVLGSCTSFLGRPRFLGSGRIGFLSGSVATGGSSTISGGASTFSEISGSSTGVVSGSGTSTGSRLTGIFCNYPIFYTSGDAEKMILKLTWPPRMSTG